MTVKGRLKEKGMIGGIVVRKPLLRPVNKQKRLKFAQEPVDWTFDQWSMKDSNQIVLCHPSGVPVLEQCHSDVGSRHFSVGTTSVSEYYVENVFLTL